MLILIVWAGIAFGCGIAADVNWRKTLLRQREAARSQSLGRKMNRGLVSARNAMEVFRAGLLLSWVILGVSIALNGVPEWLGTLNSCTLYALGLMLLGLILKPGPLAAVAAAFRAVLDVILDVINWLRPYPFKATPRARICARYAALLRHLSDPAACGKRYTRIVIVAHSYGNMVTSDLFRYLTACAEKGVTEPGLERLFPAPGAAPADRIPISYLSMASPLRQICGLRFPHQYAWARSEFEVQPAEQLPLPETLSVAAWVNMYHAGDYIGRHLWTDPEDTSSFDPAASHSVPAHPAAERCLGTGGHLHYFDADSTAVVEQIHRFISA